MNLASWIVLGVLIAIVVIVITIIVISKKKGKGCCGCSTCGDRNSCPACKK